MSVTDPMLPTVPPLRRRIARRDLLTFAAAAVALAGLPARALAAPPQAAVLSKKDYEDVIRAQDYLNGIRSLESRFEQISGEGGVAGGTIWLQRPGHMRIEYDPPVPVLIVATDGQIFYYDKKLEQISRIDIDQTPAWFLLRPDIHLGGDVTLTRFEHASGAMRLSLVETKRPDTGRVTLVFGDRPLELKQWSVIDAQNKTTTVTLADPRFGGALNPNLFYWTDPRPTGSRGG
jgi:outer membrane lipoprotein-sorting protein